MSSPTAVSNMALGHLAVSKEIKNLTTETSSEAGACRRFFDPSRTEFLRDFSYPFSTEIASLGLVESSPNNEWDYSYRYPSTCLFFRKIQSGIRNPISKARVPYRIGRDTNGKLIFTDQVDAIGEWSVDVTDISQWPSDAQMSLSLLLASYIAPRVTAGDPFKLGERALKLYEISRSKAQAASLNEQEDEDQPDGEFIGGRN